MKNVIMMSSVAVLSLGLMVSAACSDSDTTPAGPGSGGSGATGGAGATGGTGGSGAGPIEVPTLGDQIDRKGRPAINTATTQTFTDDATRAAAERAYNANDDPTTWVDMYAADKAAQLAILDALGDGADVDTDNCGDQAFYGVLNPAYGTLATVLAADWLVIDSANSGAENCGYLGVELELLGTDAGACGGRKLSDDVMDATYGAVAVGDPAGFGDGIAAPPSAQGTEFPYLTDPN